MGKASRRASREAAQGQAAATTNNRNSVEKLDLLRSFVGTSTYSETDLTNCLKQCAYNVELAAEKLLTGQYKEVMKTVSKQKNSVVTAAKQRSKNSKSFLALTGGSPSRRKTTTTTTIKRNSTASNKGWAQRQASSSSSSSTKRRSTVNPRRVSQEVISLDDDDDDDDNHTDHGKLSIPSTLPRKENTSPQGEWLLCNRWLSDAICVSRNGRVDHREELEVTGSFSRKAKPMLHFRGRGVEGRLTENLAAMLAPILRFDEDFKTGDKVSPAAKRRAQQFASSRPLIRLSCHALMSDERLPMGAHIPVSLSVKIVQPQKFFELFERDGGVKAADATAKYFEQRKMASGTAPTSSSSSSSCLKDPVARAAFDLLQWAEYGDLPDFSANVSPSKSPNGKSTGDRMETDDMEGNGDADEELDEQDFEDAASVESSEQGKEWTKSLTTNQEKEWASQLPEADDPPGFHQDVKLRPYQKQALYWMRQREVNGETREEMEEQLGLLKDLALWQQQQQQNSSLPDGPAMKEDIVCDRGPVRLSDKARQATQTIDGRTNPLSHPLWKTRYLASADKQRSLCFYVNELLGVATHSTPKPPSPCSGGILGDAMGLGKTVMLMALILQRKADCMISERNGDEPTTTLVVAKLSLLPQWEEELRSKTNLSYFVYYGGVGDSKGSLEDLKNVDVVLTTYGIIQGEPKRKNPILSKMKWLRVILDEAHCVKNTSTLASRVCSSLEAQHRWACSGTIVSNSLDDVYGVLKFLHHEPWCLPMFWKTAVTKPLLAIKVAASNASDSVDKKNDNTMSLVLDRVRRVLTPLMLRRTKDSLSKDGQPILSLPPVETKVVSVHLSAPEREFYDALLARSSELFEGFVDSGVAANSYFQIFTLIVRLRQACNHISLTVRKRLEDDNGESLPETDDERTPPKGRAKAPATPERPRAGSNDVLGSTFLDGLYSKFFSSPSRKNNKRPSPAGGDSESKRPKDDSYISSVASALSIAVRDKLSHVQEECPICLENPKIEEAVLTPCGHSYCKSCLVNFLKENDPNGGQKPTKLSFNCPDGICPLCNSKIQANKIIALQKSANGEYTTTYLTSAKAASSARAPAVKREIRDTQEGNASASARLILEDSIQNMESSKIAAVTQELENVWDLDPGSKIIIFSQFLGFLDLMEQKFKANGVSFFRLDGKLSLGKRMTVLEEFRVAKKGSVVSDSKPQRGSVLLMSMAAGGEGLNLVAASSVFIVDPWWNMAKEDQCINRIHRIGQTAAQVRVRKFVVENSVEERIVGLQQRKKQIEEEVYNDAGRTSDAGSSRLSMEDFRLIFQK